MKYEKAWWYRAGKGMNNGPGILEFFILLGVVTCWIIRLFSHD